MTPGERNPLCIALSAGYFNGVILASRSNKHRRRYSMQRTISDVVEDARRLAAEYKCLTGKPLGISGEVAEFDAHRILGVELAPPRSPGYDAVRRTNGREERIQIKGRAAKC
jgi:hypothetical protein